MFSINRPRQLDSDELGGLGAALRNAMGIYGNIQDLKKKTTENDFLPQEKAEGLKKLISDAIIRQQEARVSPEMQDAKLAHEKAQAPYLQSETNYKNKQTNWYDKEASSKIGHENAQTDTLRDALKNPLLHKTGTAGDLGSLIYLAQHPELQKLVNQNNQGNASNNQNEGNTQPEGLEYPGNIDLNKRPKVQNPDGSYSTVRTITADIDGKTVLLPTIDEKGNQLTNQQAVDKFKQDHQHLGVFNSREAADKYDQQMHKKMGWEGTNNKWGNEQNPQNKSEVQSQNTGIRVSPNESMTDTLRKSISLNARSKAAETALNEARAKGYDWGQLTAETKNQITAQGVGMGIDPLKMKKYVSEGLGIKEIAEKEGLDPDALPPPYYPPTTATKTRNQMVSAVGAELDYLSSASVPIVKQYANTYFNKSPQLYADMLNPDPKIQKKVGQYIGAMAIQTGIANDRVVLEGSKPGIGMTRLVKQSALKGIDEISPVKMSPIAFEESQKTIDKIIQRGAKIRTLTGASFFPDKEEKQENETPSSPKFVWKNVGTKQNPKYEQVTP